VKDGELLPTSPRTDHERRRTEETEHRGRTVITAASYSSFTIKMVMEEVCISETSIYFEIALLYIPEVYDLHTRCRENMKSHKAFIFHFVKEALP
jgi:hypothetical protein